MNFSDLTTQSQKNFAPVDMVAEALSQSQRKAAQHGSMKTCINCGKPATKGGCSPIRDASAKGRVWSCSQFSGTPGEGVTLMRSHYVAVERGRATVIQSSFYNAIKANQKAPKASKALLKRSEMSPDRLYAGEQDFAALVKEAEKTGYPQYYERLVLPNAEVKLNDGKPGYNPEGRDEAFWAYHDKCFAGLEQHPLFDRVVDKMISIGYGDKAAVIEQFKMGYYTLPPTEDFMPDGLPGSAIKKGNKVERRRFRAGAIMVNMFDRYGDFQACQVWYPFADLWKESYDTAHSKYVAMSTKFRPSYTGSGHAPFGVRTINQNGTAVVIAEGTNKGNKLAYQLKEGLIDLGKDVAFVLLVPGNYYQNYADVVLDLSNDGRLDVVMGIDAGAGLNRSVGTSMIKFNWLWTSLSGRGCYHTDWGQIGGSKELPDIDELYTSDFWKRQAADCIKPFNEADYAGLEVSLDGISPDRWELADIMDAKAMTTHNPLAVYEALIQGENGKKIDLYLTCDRVHADLVDKAVIRVGSSGYVAAYRRLKKHLANSSTRVIAERKMMLPDEKGNKSALDSLVRLDEALWAVHPYHLLNGKTSEKVSISSRSHEARNGMADLASMFFAYNPEEGIFFSESKAGRACQSKTREYLSSSSGKQFLAIISVGTGQGKSENMRELIAIADELKKPVLAIVPTQSLANDTSANMGLAHYRELNSTTLVTSLVTCGMSIGRAANGTGFMAQANLSGGSLGKMVKGGIVILDEVLAIFNSMFRSEITSATKEIADELIEILKGASVVIAQEATMDIHTAELVQKLMGGEAEGTRQNIEVLRIAAGAPTGNIGSARFMNRNQAITEAIQYANDGKRIAIPYGIVNPSNGHVIDSVCLENILKSRVEGLKMINLSAESMRASDSPAYKFPFEALSEYNVFAYSPVLGIGNSISPKLPNDGGKFDAAFFFPSSQMGHAPLVQQSNRVRFLPELNVVLAPSRPATRNGRTALAKMNKAILERFSDEKLVEGLNEMTESGDSSPMYHSSILGMTIEKAMEHFSEVVNSKLRKLPDAIQQWVLTQDALDAADAAWKKENFTTYLIQSGREIVTYQEPDNVAKIDAVIQDAVKEAEKLEKKIKRLVKAGKVEKIEAATQELAAYQARIAELRLNSESTVTSEEIINTKKAAVLQRQTEIAKAPELTKTRAMEISNRTGKAPTIQEFRSLEKSRYHLECGGFASLNTVELVDEYKSSGGIKGARRGSELIDHARKIRSIDEANRQEAYEIIGSEDPEKVPFEDSRISEVTKRIVLKEAGISDLIIQCVDYCKDGAEFDIESTPCINLIAALRAMTKEDLEIVGIGQLTDKYIMRSIMSLFKRHGIMVENLGQKTVGGKKKSQYRIRWAQTTLNYNAAQQRIAEEKEIAKASYNSVVKRSDRQVPKEDLAKGIDPSLIF